MKRRMLALAMVALLCWTAAAAEERAGLTAYRAKIVLYPDDEGAAVAKRLAAMYRGTLETGVDGNDSFVIALSDSGADLMRRDPAVARLEATPVDHGPASTAVAAAWKLGDYLYDGSGNIRKIGTEFFAYDAGNRLVVSAETAQAPAVNHEQTYTYDSFGNLTSLTTAGTGQTTLGVNTATNRVSTVTAAGGASVWPQYDGPGNMVGYGPATYTYDALNTMTKSVVDGVARHYAYSPADERIATFEGTAGGTRSDWTIRDQAGQVLRRYSRETNGEWKWQEDYIYRGSQMLAAEVPDTARTRHFHVDHLGTPRLITGNGGAELSRHNYHSFGVEIASPSTSAAGAPREKKQFTGHERDAESLDYMHARFYAPYMGRFLSVDPTWESADLGKPQSWNRYAYVMNNPVNMTDPDGKCPICIDLVVDLLTDGSGLDPEAKPDLTKPLFGGTVTRYMGAGEAEYARRTGYIPSTDAKGVERPTHVTTDDPVDKAKTAKKKYELPVAPTHRATVPEDRVPGGLQPTPDGRPRTSGGGSQSAATRPIPVKKSEIVPLKQSGWKTLLRWLF
jgi:RHS repeat-associated protein